MCVRNQIRDEFKEDTNCDSTYMIPIMDCGGHVICEACHMVPREQNCYLAMDNAGGHGSDVTIQ